MGLGKTLILAGAALMVIGLIVFALERFSIPIGRLPGDIVIRGKNSTFFFPVVTCLLLSVILSAVFWLIGRR
ncbi:MAG: DUF2905 domain-containing protein [Bryobacteraceae bacterium]